MWHNTARNPKLGPLDARALFPISIWALHMREWTFFVSLVGVAAFAFLMWRGYTPMVAVRIARRRLSGHHKFAVNVVKIRRWARWM